jgi:monofunctional biosynthetic peptidoglycan transglycosylase
VKRLLLRAARRIALAVAACYAAALVGLIALRWINPFTTGVQIERRVEALLARRTYRKRYTFVSLNRISSNLRHAVIAAEDTRFFQHHGIDWKEVGEVVEDGIETGHIDRGASTITQQLVKNLFFTTHRSALRKLPEFTLAPMAELVLPKQRILELYLNVIEWGPGVYGAEAAARFHYNMPAANVDRGRALRLASIIPSPRKRKPGRMDGYSEKIDNRMRQMGW